MNQTEIAYCAGLIDGESCIALHENAPGHFQPRICTEMRTPLAGQKLKEVLGGKFGPYDRKGKTIFVWRATDSEAIRVVESVLPFLREKREQADCLLGFWYGDTKGPEAKKELSRLKRPWK